MLLADQIKQARTPQEGFLLLAQAIDRLDARVQELIDADSDLMAQPLDWGEMPTTMLKAKALENALPAEPFPSQAGLEAIAEVRAALATCTDDDEKKVLNARLFLLKNPGTIPPQPVAEGVRPEQEGDDVRVVPPTEERMEKRRNFARRLTLGSFLGMEEDVAVEAFAKGGPLWLLYDGARDAVLQMPYDARQWLCMDIAEDSPAEAAEVARDILKATESVSQPAAIEALERMSNAQN